MTTPGLVRIKWFLWHGNVVRALQTVQDLEIDLDVDEPSGSQAKLLKAVCEFGSRVTQGDAGERSDLDQSRDGRGRGGPA